MWREGCFTCDTRSSQVPMHVMTEGPVAAPPFSGEFDYIH